MEQKPQPETITVYKYHKFNKNLIRLLSHHQFYCATPKQLNDPFDGAIKLTDKFITEFMHGNTSLGTTYGLYPDSVFDDFYENPIIRRVNDKKINDFKERIKYLILHRTEFTNYLLNKLGYRVISFAGEKALKNEALMWAHYADSFKGVRLTFVLPKETTLLSTEEIKIEDVIRIKEGETPEVSNEAELKQGLISKYPQWEYEDEKRILISKYVDEYPFLGFEKQYLKAIAFGVNMPPLDKGLLLRLITFFGYSECKIQLQNVDGVIDYYEPDHFEIGLDLENHPFALTL